MVENNNNRRVVVCLLIFAPIFVRVDAHANNGDDNSNSHVDNYLYTATAAMERVLKGEKILIDWLGDQLPRVFERSDAEFDELDQFLEKCKATHRVLQASDLDKFWHPVTIYLVIKRFVVEWPAVLREVPGSSEILKALDANDGKFFGAIMPEYKDLYGAADALFRLQDTYKLDSGDLADGILEGAAHSEKLSAQECYALGYMALTKLQDEYHSLIWLMEADRRFSEYQRETPEYCKFLLHLSLALSKKGNLERAYVLAEKSRRMCDDHDKESQQVFDELATIMDVMDIKPDDIDENNLPTLTNRRPDDGHVPNRDGYEALCRGENQDVTESSSLSCYYQGTTPYSKLAPFKVEVMRKKEPRIVIFRNLVSDRELSMLTSLAIPKFFTTTDFLKFRVSKSAWVADDENPLVNSVSKRIEQATGLSTETAELLHLSNYGIGGHYEPHFDYFEWSEEDIETFWSIHQTGNRIATVLLYLSQPLRGGATVFPELNVTLYPTKNDAAFWHNLRQNGEVDELTRHAACPVLVGSKWIANKWIHEHGQEFRRPCGLVNA